MPVVPPPPPVDRAHRVTIIEGNIAAGKSQLVSALDSMLNDSGVPTRVHHEPLNDDMFALMCKGLDRVHTEGKWAGFAMQIQMFMFRVLGLRDAIYNTELMVAKGVPGAPRHHLLDRSVHGDMCFAAANAEYHKWTTEMRRAYRSVCAMANVELRKPYPEDFPKPLLVWVATDVEKCMEHIARRGRKGEDAIGREYMQLLADTHLNMMLLQLYHGVSTVVAVYPAVQWRDSERVAALAQCIQRDDGVLDVPHCSSVVFDTGAQGEDVCVVDMCGTPYPTEYGLAAHRPREVHDKVFQAVHAGMRICLVNGTRARVSHTQ